jgi:hypothetical protein
MDCQARCHCGRVRFSFRSPEIATGARCNCSLCLRRGKACGVFVYIADGDNGRDGYRVNLGCVEGIDPLALEISIIDGKSVPLVEAPHQPFV